MKIVIIDVYPGAFLLGSYHGKLESICIQTFGEAVHAKVYLSLYCYNKRYLHNNGSFVRNLDMSIESHLQL